MGGMQMGGMGGMQMGGMGGMQMGGMQLPGMMGMGGKQACRPRARPPTSLLVVCACLCC